MIERKTISRRIFLAFNYGLFAIMMLLCLYPLWYVFVQSLSGEIKAGVALLTPYKPTLMNYAKVMQLEGIIRAFGISVSRTVLGTGLAVLGCMLLGYLFSREDMPCRKPLYRMVVVTMYVSGGLIPYYMVIRALGMINTYWVYIIPAIINAYYVVLVKTFSESLPKSVEESAMLDGANTFVLFVRIIMPMEGVPSSVEFKGDSAEKV